MDVYICQNSSVLMGAFYKPQSYLQFLKLLTGTEILLSLPIIYTIV